MEIRVKENQSVIDIAIEHCGNVVAVPEICQLNGVSVNQPLLNGSILKVPSVINSVITNQVNNLSTQL